MNVGLLIMLRFVLAMHVPVMRFAQDSAQLMQMIGIVIIALLFFNDCGDTPATALKPLLFHALASAFVPILIACLITQLWHDYVLPAVQPHLSSCPNLVWNLLPVLLVLVICEVGAKTVDGFTNELLAALPL